MKGTKNKVVLVLGGLDKNGGMYNYLKAWIGKLEEEGSKVAVCAIPEVANSIDDIEERIELPYNNEVKLDVIYKNLIKGKYNAELRIINDKILNFSPDYVHFIDETIFYPFLSEWFGDFPQMITVHDPIYHPGQFRRVVTRLLCLYSRLYYFTRKNLVIHFHGRAKVFPSILYFYPKKTIISHPLPKKICSDIYEPNKRPIIAFMGRIEQYKGIYLFLDSIKLYIEKYGADIDVLIVGNGGFDKLYLNQLGCNVILINRFVEDEEFHSYMASIDLLVLPYISATQSGVGYLAKAYNKKIVCTNVGNLPDLIEEPTQGVVCDVTKEAIANAINDTINKT